MSMFRAAGRPQIQQMELGGLIILLLFEHTLPFVNSRVWSRCAHSTVFHFLHFFSRTWTNFKIQKNAN